MNMTEELDAVTPRIRQRHLEHLQAMKDDLWLRITSPDTGRLRPPMERYQALEWALRELSTRA